MSVLGVVGGGGPRSPAAMPCSPRMDPRRMWEGAGTQAFAGRGSPVGSRSRLPRGPSQAGAAAQRPLSLPLRRIEAGPRPARALTYLGTAFRLQDARCAAELPAGSGGCRCPAEGSAASRRPPTPLKRRGCRRLGGAPWRRRRPLALVSGGGRAALAFSRLGGRGKEAERLHSGARGRSLGGLQDPGSPARMPGRLLQTP